MTRPLAPLQEALDALRAGTLDAGAFCRRARGVPLPPELPPRFGEVLGTLLDRLESSALFDGESCSFSQQDLLDNLQTWIDKARERVA